jgi:hypothetical protein
VQLAAPGVNVYSTVCQHQRMERHVDGDPTSLVAALFGRGMSDSNANGKINDEIRNQLMLTALAIAGATPNGFDACA